MRVKILATSLLIALFSHSYAQLNPSNVNELFKDNTVPRIDITIPPSDLSNLLGDISSDHEYKARFVFNNHDGICDTIEDVGFRIRGNVSRTVDKKSFKISINTFSPGRKYYGLEKINLKATGDDSFIRPKLCWHLCQQMGIPSIWVNHVMLYINNELWGVYTNVEHIDEVFVKKEFGNNDGNLYKCRYPASLEWLSNNTDDYKWEETYFGDRVLRVYELKTNTDEDDYTDLMTLTEILTGNPHAEKFKQQISAKINISSLLKFFALEVYMGHWDSYSFPGNNYYLYHNSASNKFEYITYDMDLTMGIDFIGEICYRNIYSYTSDASTRPLRSKILEVPEFRDNYTFYLKQLIAQFPPDTIRKRAEQIQEFIAPYVAQDPYYIYEMDEFNATLDDALGLSEYGIIEFFTLRYNSILDQLDNSNTAPIISNVNFSDVYINDQVKITCTIEDDDPNPSVKIFYQLNNNELISKEMNLISQGPLTGVYNFEIVLSPMEIPGIINFYLEAEDAEGQTLRSPYENHYTINIYSENNGLRINEIMAANSSCITDEFGEHDDWIELYNADTVPISLGNKYLSDSYNNQNEWQLPAIQLQPGQLAWFWADNQPEQGVNHAKFRLSGNGETVYLFEKRANNYLLLDSLNYPEQENNITYGVLSDDTTNTATLPQLTPGYINDTRGLAFVVFDVNMAPFIERYNLNYNDITVDVVGNFNNWSESLWFNDVSNDSIYTQTIYDLTMGETIEYRFRLNQDNDMMEFKSRPGSSGDRYYVLEEGCNTQYHYFNNFKTEENILPHSEITLYPNPVTDYLHIRFTEPIRTIQITDINGKLVKHINAGHNSNFTIDMQDLSAGVYFIKVISEKKEVMLEKLLKL